LDSIVTSGLAGSVVLLGMGLDMRRSVAQMPAFAPSKQAEARHRFGGGR
jgi:hypothetical protein